MLEKQKLKRWNIKLRAKELETYFKHLFDIIHNKILQLVIIEKENKIRIFSCPC